MHASLLLNFSKQLTATTHHEGHTAADTMGAKFISTTGQCKNDSLGQASPAASQEVEMQKGEKNLPRFTLEAV